LNKSDRRGEKGKKGSLRGEKSQANPLPAKKCAKLVKNLERTQVGFPNLAEGGKLRYWKESVLSKGGENLEREDSEQGGKSSAMER